MTTTPPNTPDGLATPAQIEALADQLSACADAIHARVIKAIAVYKGGPVPEQEQNTARALIDDELLLRQRADGLYADAATLVVKSLGKPQQHVLQLTADAAEKIAKINHLAQVASLVGSLLSFAGAVATRQPLVIVKALDNVRKHIKVMQPPAPPTPA